MVGTKFVLSFNIAPISTINAWLHLKTDLKESTGACKQPQELLKMFRIRESC